MANQGLIKISMREIERLKTTQAVADENMLSPYIRDAFNFVAPYKRLLRLR